MSEHLKNVRQELVYTQSRVDSKNKEIETEDHLKQLVEREAGRLRGDVFKLEKEQAELLEKMNSLQNQVYRGNEKMDQFKLLMNWNQEELEQWALASRQKEEDNLALLKYQRADEARIKELNLHIEKMTKEVARKKNDLEAEVTETQSAQIQLDKTAQDFRELHGERQELVRQWDEAVDAMRKRDESIQRASEAFAQRKLELREKQMALDHTAKFLDNEVANNRELDAQIAIAERGQVVLQGQFQGEKKQLSEMQDEVEVVKNTLAKAANELAVQRAGNQATAQEVETKKRHLENVRKKFAGVKRKLEGEFTQLDTLEKRQDELTRLQHQEEDRLKAAQKEVIALKDRMFKSSQQLFALRTAERDLIAEIAGGQSQNKNLTLKISTLDAQVIKQQELLYAAEFQIQQMERKVARAGGERSDEEKRQLNIKIDSLSRTLEEVSSEHSMLLSQVKRAEDDLAASRRRNVRATKESSELDSRIAELNLQCETAARSVKAAVRDKEDKMVAHDVLKLEVKRLRDVLNLRADEVFGLENRKFQLQMSMEERKQEVEVHRDVLSAQLRAVQDDMHRATLELKERALRVGKLQSKYEVLCARLKTEEGDEERSQAYYVIKAAQEREGLQREGDELDAQIHKAEKEVRALEATLGKMNEKNSMYRGSFRRVEDAGALAQRAELREKLDRAYDKMKFKRNEERALQQDVEQLDARLRNAGQESMRLSSGLQEAQTAQGRLEADLQEQLNRAERARAKASRLQRSMLERIQGGGGTVEEGRIPEEVGFELSETREINRAVLQALKVFAMEHPELQVAERAEELGLRLPSGSVGGGSYRGSQGGSRPGSAGSRSSQGSVRSGRSGMMAQQPRSVQFGGM
mmetsp:Transcript_5315/g.17662  ORF Transcript_5315/g.17662 Transcript_5315/m.17662 type:complete len:868 (+) Transcript_5315:644-3247(+)